MKRASAMQAIYFYETSRPSQPFFSTAMLEQRSVPISLMDGPSATADRRRLFRARVSHDGVDKLQYIVP